MKYNLLVASALFLTISSAFAEAWQNSIVHAGETKSISVPSGKLIEFLPFSESPNGGVSIKLDFGGGAVVPSAGTGAVTPPSSFAGPIIVSVTCSKTAPYSTPASFVVITFRIKDNL
jgi:hypothetical protein